MHKGLVRVERLKHFAQPKKHVRVEREWRQQWMEILSRKCIIANVLIIYNLKLRYFKSGRLSVSDTYLIPICICYFTIRTQKIFDNSLTYFLKYFHWYIFDTCYQRKTQFSSRYDTSLIYLIKYIHKIVIFFDTFIV
jgi:hypothetical protein